MNIAQVLFYIVSFIFEIFCLYIGFILGETLAEWHDRRKWNKEFQRVYSKLHELRKIVANDPQNTDALHELKQTECDFVQMFY